MSRPIKISDELYKKLKSQAEAEGMTLQDALVDLLAEPHVALAEFRREIVELSAKADAQRKRETEFSTAVSRLQEGIRELSRRLDALRQARDRDTETFNEWVETWNLVPGLAKAIPSLETRIAALERLKHQHVWQTVANE